MMALITLKKEIEDIIKIGRSLGESGLLIKGYRETIKNEAKEQKGTFLEMLLGTLASSIFGNLLAGKPKTLELVKEQLEQVRIFNATSSFNLF